MAKSFSNSTSSFTTSGTSTSTIVSHSSSSSISSAVSSSLTKGLNGKRRKRPTHQAHHVIETAIPQSVVDKNTDFTWYACVFFIHIITLALLGLKVPTFFQQNWKTPNHILPFKENGHQLISIFNVVIVIIKIITITIDVVIVFLFFLCNLLTRISFCK